MEPTFAGCSNGQPCRVTPEPYTDWFLQTDKTPVYSMSACEQMGLGYSNPGTDKCANLIWNVSSTNTENTRPEPPQSRAAGTHHRNRQLIESVLRGSGGERFDA